MGACSSTPDPSSHLNKEINRQLATCYYKEAHTTNIKMLLLGAGESGKSTCMKQMQILHGKGLLHNKEHLKQKRDLVRQNSLQALTMLCQAMDIYKLEYEREGSEEHAATVKGLQPTDVTLDMKERIQYLWQDEGLKRALAFKSEINLLDSAEYFLSALERTFDPAYVPTEQDILRSRTPTCGVTHYTFKWDHMDVNLFDVGGQRGQRKKWINCFEDVTAVIFVASLSEFDQRLEEDPDSNRMEESLKLFQAINELQWFTSTATIIFFNKEDVFLEKLGMGHSLTNWFPEYLGNNDFQSAYDFIEDMYLKRTAKEKGKKLYTHITKATDTQLMRNTMKAVQHFILTESLKNANLIL